MQTELLPLAGNQEIADDEMIHTRLLEHGNGIIRRVHNRVPLQIKRRIEQPMNPRQLPKFGNQRVVKRVGLVCHDLARAVASTCMAALRSRRPAGVVGRAMVIKGADMDVGK